jgi:hypothetical protein
VKTPTMALVAVALLAGAVLGGEELPALLSKAAGARIPTQVTANQ